MSQEAAHQVGQGASDEEILLDEAQALPTGRGVIGIQHPGKGFRFESLTQRSDEVCGAEFLKVEVIWCCRSPEPESVDRLSSIAHDRAIKRYADQTRRAPGNYCEITSSQYEGTV